MIFSNFTTAHNLTTNGSSQHDGVPSNVFLGRKTEVTVWLVVSTVVTSLGVILNLSVLTAAWPQRSHRSSFNLLICHFVLLYLFMCLVNIPINIAMVIAAVTGFQMPTNICDDVQTVWGIPISLINWSDAGLAFNRCIALFFPHQYAAWSTTRANIGIIGVSWLICVGARVATVLASNATFFKLTPVGQCTAITGTFVGAQAYVGLTTTLPYVLTGLGAVLILWKSTVLSRRNNQIRPGNLEPTPVLRHRLKMARMLLLTFLWTLICMVPNYVVLTFTAAAVRSLTVSVLWLRIIAPFQYALTPCILLLSNKEYRRRLASVLGGGMRHEKSARIDINASNTLANTGASSDQNK